MRIVSCVVALVSSLLVAGSLWAANPSPSGPEGKRPRGDMVELEINPGFFFRQLLQGLNVTDDQKAKLREIQKEYTPKVEEMRKKLDGVPTDEQRKARADAARQAREAGKDPTEVRLAAREAEKLTDEQKAKKAQLYKEAMPLLNEMNEKAMAVLTDEQKAQIKEKMSQPRSAGKRKPKPAGETGSPLAPQLSNSKTDAPQITFTVDFSPGAKDSSGQYMGGTETVWLIAHGGRLFAGMGYWSDEPGKDPQPGAQVLRKNTADGPWSVDVEFGQRYRRVEGMFSAVLTTDRKGKPLKTPANLLVAGPSDVTEKEDRSLTAWVRDDASGKWAETVIAANQRGGVRSFAAHLDMTTKIHLLFAGTNRGIYRGAYDPAAPHKLVWVSEPELNGVGRVMCFAECNGDLYAACGLRAETTKAGGLYRRLDGEKPKWEQVYRWPYNATGKSDENRVMRGLTAVPDPAGGGYDVLLGTRTFPGVIERIDPRKNHAVTLELDIRAFVAHAWDTREYHGPCLSAYNSMVPFTDPKSGEKVYLIGLCVQQTPATMPPHNIAYYLIRRASDKYELREVRDVAHPVPAGQTLRAVRTISLSPFQADRGRVLYFGGFDAYGGPHHNTAWIYKGALSAATEDTAP